MFAAAKTGSMFLAKRSTFCEGDVQKGREGKVHKKVWITLKRVIFAKSRTI